MALHRHVLIACWVVLSLSACTQAEDEACQVDSDCEDGLVCFGTGLRGMCVPPDQANQDAGTPDGGGDDMVDPDASVRDASADDDAG
jgi:hypothetical protein